MRSHFSVSVWACAIKINTEGIIITPKIDQEMKKSIEQKRWMSIKVIQKHIHYSFTYN